MKKFFTFFAACMIGAVVTVNANNSDLFNYDETEVAVELQDLNKLENYVIDNNATYTELASKEEQLISDLNLSKDAVTSLSPMEPPFGIPSFLWGCVLGLVGVLVVYFVTDKDKDETKKALFGCLAFGGAYLIYWIFWVAIGIGSSTI